MQHTLPKRKFSDCFYLNQFQKTTLEKPRKKIVRKLKSVFRLVILNDQTFEEKLSIRLTPMNVFVFAGTIIISLITFTIYIIAFTPLREYIPGYADVNMQRNVVLLASKTDSLSKQLESRDRYLANLQAVISGDIPADQIKKPVDKSARYDTIDIPGASPAEKNLREEMESRDRFSLYAETAVNEGSLANFLFFAPVKGIITSEFNPKIKHFGVDIVASANEVIKSTLDGTVIFSDWTSDTGYVIAIQHGNNIFSVYKHNSALLKSVGDFVKAGEVVAIIGDSGETSNGPHLHFELWYNGMAVNPTEYIAF